MSHSTKSMKGMPKIIRELNAALLLGAVAVLVQGDVADLRAVRHLLEQVLYDAAPEPVGSGAVMWTASAEAP